MKNHRQMDRSLAAAGAPLAHCLESLFFSFIPFFWMLPSNSLLPLRSHRPSRSVLCCGSLTRRVKCVFAVVYRQDVTAIRSSPICFQIRGAQWTKRQDRNLPPTPKKTFHLHLLLNAHFCLVVQKHKNLSHSHTITNKTFTNPLNTQPNQSELCLL